MVHTTTELRAIESCILLAPAATIRGDDVTTREEEELGRGLMAVTSAVSTATKIAVSYSIHSQQDACTFHLRGELTKLRLRKCRNKATYIYIDAVICLFVTREDQKYDEEEEEEKEKEE